MLRGLAHSVSRLPDWRLMPDPWVARPLRILDRHARGEIDLGELYDDVILANGRIAAMLPPELVDALEAHVLDAEEAPDWTAARAKTLAVRVREELGEGFAVGVLRAGHPDWQEWCRQHPSRTEEIAQEAAYRAASRELQVETPRRGWRQRSKPTKAERRAAFESATGGKVSIRLDADDLRRMTEARHEDAQERKRGVAEVLMRGGWRGVEDEHGPWEFTLERRLELLGVPEPIRDDEGRIFQVLADQAYGPAPAGDAIAAWLLEASEDLEGGHAEWLEDAGDFLPATPPGTGATSEG